jgi:hypothetical protein
MIRQDAQTCTHMCICTLLCNLFFSSLTSFRLLVQPTVYSLHGVQYGQDVLLFFVPNTMLANVRTDRSNSRSTTVVVTVGTVVRLYVRTV